MSRATLDRKLRPARSQLLQDRLSRTRPGTWPKDQIPARTIA